MSMSGYQELARMAERELEIARRGAHDELIELAAAREALIATLPAKPPSDAQPHLERALVLWAQANLVLEHSLGAMREQLVGLARGRGAISGYAAAVERPHRVDHAR